MTMPPARPHSIKVQLGPATLEMPMTDAILRAAIGLTIEQCGMLRAAFEDAHGVDPASLSPDEIAFLAAARAKSAAPRRHPPGSKPPIPVAGSTEEPQS